MRTDLGDLPAPELTSGALGMVPMVIGMWPVLLGGAFLMNQHNGRVAEKEKANAVDEAINKTKAIAAAAKFSNVRTTPLGFPVLPEV